MASTDQTMSYRSSNVFCIHQHKPNVSVTIPGQIVCYIDLNREDCYPGNICAKRLIKIDRRPTQTTAYIQNSRAVFDFCAKDQFSYQLFLASSFVFVAVFQKPWWMCTPHK